MVCDGCSGRRDHAHSTDHGSNYRPSGGKAKLHAPCGLLAGSMTDSAALAFAGTVTGSEAPAVSYATVYPLVMILRILTVQAMILYFR